MKKITEQQLLESVNKLNSYLTVYEAQQPNTSSDFSAQNVGKALGNIWQGVKNTAGAVGNAVSGATDAVGNAASNVAAGFNSAQNAPVAAQAAPAAKPATTKQPDPAVVKIQQDLVAKGFDIKVDGIMGPKTKEAMEYDAADTEFQQKQAQAQAQPATQPATQPVQPMPGMNTGLAAASNNLSVPFQSQQPIKEHVSFGQEDSLARIIQLARN